MSSTHLFVRQPRLQAALLARVAQQGGEGAKAEVIVVLPGELLHGQGVQRVHLLGQDLEDKREEATTIPPDPSVASGVRYPSGRLAPGAQGSRAVLPFSRGDLVTWAVRDE